MACKPLSCRLAKVSVAAVAKGLDDGLQSMNCFIFAYRRSCGSPWGRPVHSPLEHAEDGDPFLLREKSIGL